MTATAFDFIVVGAGSAGCVVAGRLSEAGHRVLLIEAGEDTPPGREPSEIRDVYARSYGDPKYFWPDLPAAVSSTRTGAAPLIRNYEQARVFGGGGHVMGMMAVRGLPWDYDRWRALGAPGWGWTDVLPSFRRLERDLEFGATDLHGDEGPIPIRRIAREEWPPFCRAIADAAIQNGAKFVEDFNGDPTDGVGQIPSSNVPTQRVSSAMAYLGAEARRRPNLTIIADREVDELLWRDNKVAGVVVTRDGNRRDTYEARETILCAGAIHSPTLLMRSGIGAAPVLQHAGVTVRHHLAGVGSNLLNHPFVSLAVHLPERSAQPAALHEGCINALRFSSGETGCQHGDMMMLIINKTSWHPLGRRIGSLGIGVYDSRSRGTVTLRRDGAKLRPDISFNLLSDDRDFYRMVSGVRLACRLLSAPGVRAVTHETFLPDPRLARRLNKPRLTNALLATMIAGVMATGSATRRWLLGDGIIDPETLANDDDALRELVNSRAGPMGHVAGTCRIGSENDPHAVVGSDCRVHGVGGLRVIDGSVMPAMVSANTNIPIIMIAEHATAKIVAGGYE